MNRKGNISTIDNIKRTATVVFKSLDNAVSGHLPIITSENIGDYHVGDLVVVNFFGDNLTDGAIVGRIGGG